MVLEQLSHHLIARSVWEELSGSCLDDLAAIEVFDAIDSTQLAIQSRSLQGRDWLACVALQQRAGFGRQGRVWQSVPGQVALSWRGWLSIPTASIGLMSLAAALAIGDVLDKFQVKGVGFKWPNDIYIQDKKLAGVLVSICQQKGNRFDAVLGVGLNRLHLSLPEQAIALADIIPNPPSLSTVLAELLMAWHQWKSVLMSEDGRKQVRVAWLERALWMNTSVRVWLHNGYVDGVFVGITSSGLLRVATESGEMVFAAGEVQLRPLD